jgi:diguanylate cyclase
LFARIFPPVPDEVQDAFSRLLFRRMVKLSPLLHMGIAATVISAAFASAPQLSMSLRLGLLAVVLCICGVRTVVWLRRASVELPAAQAERRLWSIAAFGSVMAVISSAWAVTTWYGTPLEERTYVPIFMTVAALAATSCMVGLRTAALASLSICVLPMIAVLMTSPSTIHKAIGVTTIVLSALQVRVVLQQHAHIVESLLLERKMRLLANTDMLTELPNRRAFFEEVEEHLSHTDDCIVALLDLDGFKPVNDSLGHFAGDQLLMEVAKRLRGQMDDTMFVSRLGGDEFAILFRNQGDMNAASAKATGILAALSVPCTINGQRVSVTASIGLARFPPDGATATELLTAADAALYAAKQEGRAQFKVADPSAFQAKAA